MARTVIPTNFQDDELAEEMQGRRRYRQILNADGTVSFEDETDYDTEGSTFGASRVNEMAQNINESADVNKIIDDLEDISVVTQNGFIAGAKAVKTLNNNLGIKVSGFSESGYSAVTGLAYDATNNKLGLKVGADTVIPFSSGAKKVTITGYTSHRVMNGDMSRAITSWNSNFTIVIDLINKTVTSKSISGNSGYAYDTMAQGQTTGITISNIIVE